MPEGDTVYQAARELQQRLGGQVLKRTDFRVPALATSTLEGQTVQDVRARGKHLMLRTDGGWTLHTHFQMEGAWKLYRAGERWRGGPGHEIRIVLETPVWTAVAYRMPVIDLVKSEHEDRLVGHLGPDLLGPDWDMEEALRRLGCQGAVEIGEALLDQTCLAGVGNVYKCETLFLRGDQPFRTVAEIRDLRATVTMAHRLMVANRDRRVRSTTGRPRPDNLWVYGREGQPCRRCGTGIERRTQGSDPLFQRATWWCPHCQPV